VYKRCHDKVVTFLLLYVDDILLIGNDVSIINNQKILLSNQFDMKHLAKASYILGIKIWRDRKIKMLGLSQATYIEKIMSEFNMQDSNYFPSGMEFSF
jgi:hypothetical protein